jgi:hypothetical protein
MKDEVRNRMWKPLVFRAIFLLFLTSYFMVPLSSFAQGRYVALSSGTVLKIFPDTIIDFGRVRVGQERDSFFILHDSGSQSIELTSLNFSESLTDSSFNADSVKSNIIGDIHTLNPGNSVNDTVYFHPTHVGRDSGNIPIYWTLGAQKYNYPTIHLLGIGVAPNVVSSNHVFPDERVDSASSPVTISIVNVGSDTTAIDSVTIVDSSEIIDSDFQVTLDSLPPSGSPLRIDYEGNDTAFYFVVQFQPHSLGLKTLVIRIHTVDGDAIFDTLTGAGVEPLVLLNPQTIDFGTITLQPNKSLPMPIDSFFVVSNAFGTYPAILDTLVYHDTASNFAVQLNQPATSHETLAAGSKVMGTATFNITKVGDFVDTVYIPNDTRYDLYSADSNYQPRIVLKAKVRIGRIGSFRVPFDTITNCDTSYQNVTITNPYPVEASIDSIAFVSDTGGFSYVHNIGFPINILPNGSYASLQLAYSFPLDSLNGSQALKMLLFQSTLDSEAPMVDTVTASLIRMQQTITLAAHLPPAGSVGTSAADIAELRVPITLEGLRSGVAELNSWTLSLQFSNNLFMPTAVDTTGSLSVAGDASYSLTTYWDQSTLTYTILATGTSVSDPAKIADNLLLAILMQAYVTTDTVVTVTPTFTWATRPCAYNLQSFTLSIPYAEDCGDQTIRESMEGETPSFILTGAWPNPASKSDEVSIGYRAAQPSEVTTTVYNVSGEELGHIVTAVGVGAGTIALPEQLIPSSGPAFVRVEALSADGSISAVQTCKIAAIK